MVTYNSLVQIVVVLDLFRILVTIRTTAAAAATTTTITKSRTTSKKIKSIFPNFHYNHIDNNNKMYRSTTISNRRILHNPLLESSSSSSSSSSSLLFGQSTLISKGSISNNFDSTVITTRYNQCWNRQQQQQQRWLSIVTAFISSSSSEPFHCSGTTLRTLLTPTIRINSHTGIVQLSIRQQQQYQQQFQSMLSTTTRFNYKNNLSMIVPIRSDISSRLYSSESIPGRNIEYRKIYDVNEIDDLEIDLDAAIDDNDDDDDDQDHDTYDEEEEEAIEMMEQNIQPQSISSWLQEKKQKDGATNPGKQQQQQHLSKGPWTVPESISIPESRVEFSYVRSSGAGGQNVNKLNTQVQVRFKVMDANWIPLEVRERLVEQQQGKAINKDGYLFVSAQEHRTQLANKRSALHKIESMIIRAWARPNIRLAPRVGLSDISKLRRKTEKQHRKKIKESRRKDFNLDY